MKFGAVGNGLSYALGVAAARWQGREGKIVLFEGDGGLLFHIKELETIKRQGFRVLICAMNDGGYGSEFHKLARRRPRNIARGFGLRGHEIRDVSVIPKLFADFAAQGESEMWKHASARTLLNLSPEGYKLWNVAPENQRCSSKLPTGTATKFRLTLCE